MNTENPTTSASSPINGEVTRKMAEIDAMTPEQQRAITERLLARFDPEAERQRRYEAAQRQFDASLEAASAAGRLIREYAPPEDEEEEPEEEPVKFDGYLLDRFREIERERLLKEDPEPRLKAIDGVTFEPMAKYYFKEAMVIAAHLILHEDFDIVPRPEYDDDPGQKFFSAVETISRGLFAVRHDMLNMDLEYSGI